MRRRSYTATRLAGLPAPAPTVAQPVSPLGQAVRATCEAIARHEIEPCPVCGRFDCTGCGVNPDGHCAATVNEELLY